MSRRPVFRTVVSPEEQFLVGAGCAVLLHDEADGDAVHLRADRKGRHWVIGSGNGQLTIDWPDPNRRTWPDLTLAISDRLRRFTACCDHREVELTLPEARTVMARVGSMSAAIDLVADAEPLGEPLTLSEVTAVARMPLQSFTTLLTSARIMPSGIDENAHAMPPMWMRIGGSALALHVDWTEFGPGRATYRLDLPTDDGIGVCAGELTVPIPHGSLEMFLHHLAPLWQHDSDYEVELNVGTLRRSGDDSGDRGDSAATKALELVGDGWRLVLVLPDPLAARWSARVEQVLDDADLPVLDRSRHEWVVGVGGAAEVRVKLHYGRPDVARVSATAVNFVDESLELLRELSSLNAAAVGVRYWFEEGAVHVAVDVPCTELGGLPIAVGHIAAARHDYGPLLAALGPS